jgi:hypothetical protein
MDTPRDTARSHPGFERAVAAFRLSAAGVELMSCSPRRLAGAVAHV